MNKEAEELAQLMADRNAGMTYVIIAIVVLLGVAVFANLYSTIKNPGGNKLLKKAKMLVE